MERDLVFPSGVDWLAVSTIGYLLGSALLTIVSLGRLKSSRESDSKVTSILLSFSFIERYIGAPARKFGKIDDYPAGFSQSTWIRILKLYNQWIQVGRTGLLQNQRERHG